MLIFIVIEFTMESGPGAIPSVNVYLFRNAEEEEGFVKIWITGHEKIGNIKGDDMTFYGNNYSYWLERQQKEI